MSQSQQGKRHGRRSRRARRRKFMLPAEAHKLSTRTRKKGWLITKSVTRFHRRASYWEDWAKY